MTAWIIANWEWILVGFYTLEKIVKLSPSKKDDIIFDSVIKPVWDQLPFGKKQNKALNKSLSSKKKAVTELDKTKYKKSNTSKAKAADFLKNYKKKK